MISPELQRLHDDHEVWIQSVRDPAKTATEGPRRISAGRAEAEYEIAPLPDGRFALRFDLSMPESGWGNPWEEYPTREDCITQFLTRATRFFKGKKDMLVQLSNNTLFGWEEPDVDREWRKTRGEITSIIEAHSQS